MRHRLPALPAVVAGLLLSAAAVRAQESEDPELARGLARRGWFDLAEEICTRLQKSSKASAEDKATGQFVQAEILLERAERETDVANSMKHIDSAIELLRNFMKSNSTHPLAMDAKTNVGYLQVRKAKFLKDALDAETDPSKVSDLRKQAASIYGEVAKFYQDTIAELKGKPRTPESENAMMDARLELPRAMYEHAKLPGVDEKDRSMLLTKAIGLFVDFEFDYGDRPIAFEGMLDEGRCLLEMGEYKKAETKLRGTLALKGALIQAKPPIPINDYHKKILYGAQVALAQLLTRSGKAADARTMINGFFKENASASKEWVWPALKLELADALFSLKDMGGANKEVNEVIKMDPNGRFGSQGRQMMNRWGAGGGAGAIRLSPEQLMTSAEGNLDRDQHREAIANFRKAIESCSTDAERQKFAAAAYFKIGQSLQAMKRNYEAAFSYEQVFVLYPKHELAAKACYEATRCYNQEFGISGDKRDDEAKDRLLTILGSTYKDLPEARNIAYIQAEKVETTGDIKKAAALYAQVSPQAEAYESALVRSGYCYHVDAAAKWAKGSKDPAVQADVKAQMKLAEEVLQKFVARLADSSTVPKEPELVKMRQNLSFIANQRLALIYMHDAVGRTEDCLKFLEQCAKDIPPDDERLGKIWGLQIQGHLVKGNLDKAVQILDVMFEKFPDGEAIARACKSVAIRLDEKTGELEKAKAPAQEINANLRRVSKYYAKWLNEGPARGLKITMADVTSVAEALYMIAKRINGLDENTTSFLDLKGKPIAEKQYWEDAAFVHTLLVDGKVGRLSDKDKITLMTRLARCYSFTAKEAADWDKAKDNYDNIIKSYKLVDPTGRLDMAVLGKHRELLGVYVELGHTYLEIGRKGQKFQLDNAESVFTNVLGVTEKASEPWWLARYMILAVLFERGKDRDFSNVKLGIENLERNYADFDGGKFGMKERFLELKKKVGQVSGS